MSVMGKKVWAVMCGQMRRPFELNLTLAELLDFRNEGLIEGIVVSTWKGEIDSVPGLREKYVELGIVMVEIDPIDESLEKYVELSYLRQAFQLKSGIIATPDDVFILKCRSDYSHDRIKNCRDVLEGNVDLTLGTHGMLDFGMRYKIAVYRFSSNLPFGLLDGGFLGYKTDLLPMTAMELPKLRYGYLIGTDFQWYLNLFNNRFPIIDDVMMLMTRYLTVGTSHSICSLKLDCETFELPGMFNKFYALYCILLYNCFYLLEEDKYIKVEDDISLLDVVQCKAKAGMGFDWLATFKNPETLYRMLNGKLKLTSGYTKLYSEILNLKSERYAQSCTVTREDYDETWNWLRDVVNLNPEQWLREYNKTPASVTTGKNFQIALEYMYDGNQVYKDKELSYIMHYCVYGKKGWFYSRLAEVLDVIQAHFGEIYYEALSTAGRSESVYVLNKIASLAKINHLEPYANNICMYWKRRATDRWWAFYNVLNGEKLVALYNYVCYEELKNEHNLGPIFYQQLCKWLGVGTKSGINNYTAEILNICVEYVNSKYGTEDDKVKQVTKFLIDESGFEFLSEQTKEHLKLFYIKRIIETLPLHNSKTSLERLINVAKTVDAEEIVSCVKDYLLCAQTWCDDEYKDILEKIILGWKEKGLLQQNSVGTMNTILEYLKKKEKLVLLSNIGQTVWLNLKSDKDIQEFETKHYQVPRNANGYLWPHVGYASNSPYAMRIDVLQEKIVAEIYYVSLPTYAKSILCASLSDKYTVNEEDMVNCLKRVEYVIDSNMTHTMAIEKVCDEFINIGGTLATEYTHIKEKYL